METTVAKAKKMSGTAWKGGFLILIHAGVNLFACPGTQCAARRAASFVRGDDVLHKDRAGRCTRLLRTRIQVGDAAPMAYMEQSKPPTPQPPQRAALDPRSLLSRQFAPPKEEKSGSDL
ncbi:hypothetical protein ACSQ67_018928 [Phaseolus vulgaris]